MSNREWKFYLEDMICFAKNVLAYSDGFDLKRFESTGINYDATIRNLELMGEAAIHIPTEIKETNSDIPWRLL